MNFRIHDPYAVPGEYCKVQLHCHTTESDGRIRPRELLRMYKEAGYAFVFITDHNRVTRCDDLDDNTFLALPGTEDTVSYLLPPLGPHLGRLFVDRPMRQGTAQERIDRTAAEGGLAALCHPSWTGNLWTGTWSQRAVVGLRAYNLVEIVNPHSDTGADTARWEAALRERGPESPVWAVAVDDCHRRDQFNRAWVMVRLADRSPRSLRSSLAGGAFYAST
ncbi:MAG: PHP domain-containing protein, partial [bacterium]